MRELNPTAVDIWEDIGIELDIDDGQLKRIKSESASNLINCLREMLRLWLTTVNPLPSWTKMVDSLIQLKKSDIAEHLRNKYLTTIV